MNKKNAILMDLDGTIANIDHRLHFVRQKPKNWKGFFDAMSEDGVYDWCILLVNSMYNSGYHIIIVSGRPDPHRYITMDWLRNNIIPCDHLLMRKEDDFRSDSLVKAEIFKNKIKPYYNILFAVDDRSSVVKTWRELGLVCLQCNEGNF